MNYVHPLFGCIVRMMREEDDVFENKATMFKAFYAFVTNFFYLPCSVVKFPIF